MRCTLLFLIACCSVGAMASEGWLVHITPEGSFYRSDVVVVNTSQMIGNFGLYRPDGSIWQEAEVLPGQTLLVPPISDSPAPTHLRFQSQHPWLRAALRYSGAGMVNHPLVPAIERSALVHRYALNFSPSLWHGLALLNVGSKETAVTFRQYSEDGSELLLDAQLHAGLEVGDKLATSLSALSVRPGSSVVELLTSEAVVVVVLEGNYAGEVPGFITAVAPLSQSNESITMEIVGGLIFTHTTITLLEGQLGKGIEGDLPTEANFRPVPNYDQVLADLESMGIYNLEVESQGSNCCDNYAYSLSITGGKGSHSLVFHDDDLSSERPGTVQAKALIDYINALDTDL